jgi:hypothetical protein
MEKTIQDLRSKLEEDAKVLEGNQQSKTRIITC